MHVSVLLVLTYYKAQQLILVFICLKSIHSQSSFLECGCKLRQRGSGVSKKAITYLNDCPHPHPYHRKYLYVSKII